MATRLEILQAILDGCKAHSVRVVNEAGLFLTLEIIINRKDMADCALHLVNERGFKGDVRGIERINKGELGYSETGEGLYRYTIMISKEG